MRKPIWQTQNIYMVEKRRRARLKQNKNSFDKNKLKTKIILFSMVYCKIFLWKLKCVLRK